MVTISKQKAQQYHIGAAIVAILMIILIVYLWRGLENKNAKQSGGKRSQGFSGSHTQRPTWYNKIFGYPMPPIKDAMYG